MKVEWAILSGAGLIAASIIFTNHWEMGMRPEGAIFRLNRWTGEISACAPHLENGDESKVQGFFGAVCDDKINVNQ